MPVDSLIWPQSYPRVMGYQKKHVVYFIVFGVVISILRITFSSPSDAATNELLEDQKELDQKKYSGYYWPFF